MQQADLAKVKDSEEHEVAPTCSSLAGMSDMSNGGNCGTLLQSSTSSIPV